MNEDILSGNNVRTTVRSDVMSHDVALNYFVPPVNNALGMNSAFNSLRVSLPNQIEFRDDWTF